jgi:hypothetical protein
VEAPKNGSAANCAWFNTARTKSKPFAVWSCCKIATAGFLGAAARMLGQSSPTFHYGRYQYEVKIGAGAMQYAAAPEAIENNNRPNLAQPIRTEGSLRRDNDARRVVVVK